LGDNETGGGAALPIWMSYMGKILKDMPEAVYTMPENMVTARINENGLRDPDGNRIEYFYQENIPPAVGEKLPGESGERIDSVKDQLF
jgi:penicillin-binding protein 1A